MEDWVCEICGRANESFSYQCQACMHIRAADSADDTTKEAWNAVATKGENLYQILGVGPKASDEEIHAAYVAKDEGPFPGIGQDQSDEGKTIDLAYRVLGDPGKREKYDKSLGALFCPSCNKVFHDPKRMRDHIAQHDAELCQLCGRGPTSIFTFKSNKGLLIFRSVSSFDGRLCRSCATGMYRAMQTRNLSWGWFGFISFFATIGYAIGNSSSYYSGCQNLTSPTPINPVLDRKVEGIPIWRGVLPRLAGIAAFVAVVVLILAYTVFNDSETGTATANYSGRPATTVTTQALPPLMDSIYLDKLPPVIDARNDLIDLSNTRMEDWNSSQSDAPPGPQHLVVNELAALQTQIASLVTPLDGELRTLHENWEASVRQLTLAERSLLASFTQVNITADVQAWEKEATVFGALLDYYNSHLIRLPYTSSTSE
jgi:hypothetical protein